MAIHPHYNLCILKYCLPAFVLLFTWYSAFAQNTAGTDSSKITATDTSKTKKQPVTDSTFKHGYAKIVLLGHERIIALPALQDSDGDGVPDQLDLEPNTPPGVAVDAHGRALDTDGDGVPDYRDKEKLTLQKCFPVDSNGVGTCPEPSCCKEVRKEIKDSLEEEICCGVRCSLSELPSVVFGKGSSALNNEAIGLLRDAARKLQSNPTCNVKIIGYYGSGASNVKAQQLSWGRVNAVIKYLVEKEGIWEEGRLIFLYGQKGNADSVDLLPTSEYSNPTIPRPPRPKH